MKPGNQNAKKPDEEILTSKLFILCHPIEKSAWIAHAKPQKLSAWVRSTLNKAAGRPEEPTPGELRHIKM